jgi:phosphatidylglycerol:prolipoprotein diacylglycerol transferase
MDTGFRHDFDLAFGHIFGVPLYWYGAVYTVGFAGIFLWLWFRRSKLGWSRRDAAELTICVAAGILIGGRAFDIVFYELPYYRDHPMQMFNWWRGGLASHGVLIGSITGAALFSSLRGKSFLRLADEVVVPAAFLFAVGRLGNFIEGGVVGIPTDMPWGVIYPDLDGARHPVALYESAKNFLIMPILIAILGRYPAGRGVAMSAFVFLYALLRFLVDLLRDYESYWMLGIDTGQVFNLIMAAIGAALLVLFLKRARTHAPPAPDAAPDRPVGLARALLLAFLCLYPLGIPTSWTKINIEERRSNGVQS